MSPSTDEGGAPGGRVSSGGTGARVRRFANLRAAHRALLPSACDALDTLDGGLVRKLRDRLRVLSSRQQGGVAALDAELGDVDAMLDGYAQQLRGIFDELSLAQIRASVSSETQAQRVEVRALLRLCLEAEPELARYLRQVDFLLTLLCTARRPDHWELETDPIALDALIAQRSARAPGLAPEEVRAIVERFDDAADQLAIASDATATVRDLSAYKLEIAPHYFLPEVLRSVMRFNAEARNAWEDRARQGRAADAEIDDALGRFVLNVHEAPQQPEAAAESPGQAEPEAAVQPAEPVQCEAAVHPSEPVQCEAAVHPSEPVQCEAAVHPSEPVQCEAAVHPSEPVQCEAAVHPSEPAQPEAAVQTVPEPRAAPEAPGEELEEALAAEPRAGAPVECSSPYRDPVLVALGDAIQARLARTRAPEPADALTRIAAALDLAVLVEWEREVLGSPEARRASAQPDSREELARLVRAVVSVGHLAHVAASHAQEIAELGLDLERIEAWRGALTDDLEDYDIRHPTTSELEHRLVMLAGRFLDAVQVSPQGALPSVSERASESALPANGDGSASTHPADDDGSASTHSVNDDRSAGTHFSNADRSAGTHFSNADRSAGTHFSNADRSAGTHFSNADRSAGTHFSNADRSAGTHFSNADRSAKDDWPASALPAPPARPDGPSRALVALLACALTLAVASSWPESDPRQVEPISASAARQLSPVLIGGYRDFAPDAVFVGALSQRWSAADEKERRRHAEILRQRLEARGIAEIVLLDSEHVVQAHWSDARWRVARGF